MRLILVGKVLAPHGVKGLVVIKSFTESITNILQLPLVDKNNNRQTIKLISQNSKGNLICKLNEISDRDAAEIAKGLQLFCSRTDLSKPDEDEFYIEDLKGIKLVNKHLQPIGLITGVFNFGAGDIIEIRFNDNSSELLAFTKECFPIINKEYAVLDKKS